MRGIPDFPLARVVTEGKESAFNIGIDKFSFCIRVTEACLGGMTSSGASPQQRSVHTKYDLPSHGQVSPIVAISQSDLRHVLQCYVFVTFLWLFVILSQVRGYIRIISQDVITPSC